MNNNNRLASDSSPDLGLSQFPEEPFSDTDDPNFFYPEHTRIQRLRLLLHLISLDEILLIVGAPGAGKTMLLKQFLLQAKETASINLIDVYDIENEIQFITAIAETLNLDLTEKAPEQPLKSQILDAISDLKQTTLRTILAIDNAHKLNIDCLQCIETIVHHAQKHSKPLHIVIAGDLEIQQTLEHPDLKKLKQSILHTFEIPPFDEHQTKEYILHRLHAANDYDSSLFTPAVIKRIYKRSEGLPERINVLARQIIDSQEGDELLSATPSMAFSLENATEKSQEKDLISPLIQKVKSMWNTTKLIPAILIVSAIAFIAILQSVISSHFSDETTTQHTEALTLPIIEEHKERPIVTPQTTKNSIHIVSTDQTLPLQPIPASITLETPQITKEKIPENRLEQIDMPKFTSKPTTSTTQPIAKNPVQAEKQTTVAASEIKSQKWINQQNKEHYTLQVFAISKEEAMRDFIKKNQLTDQSAYLHIERNGENLYAMLYGSYENHGLASNAIKNLPASLASFKPWIRSYGSIQKAMKNNP